MCARHARTPSISEAFWAPDLPFAASLLAPLPTPIHRPTLAAHSDIRPPKLATVKTGSQLSEKKPPTGIQLYFHIELSCPPQYTNHHASIHAPLSRAQRRQSRSVPHRPMAASDSRGRRARPPHLQLRASPSPLRLRCSAALGCNSPLSSCPTRSDGQAAQLVLAPTTPDSCLEVLSHTLWSMPYVAGGEAAAPLRLHSFSPSRYRHPISHLSQRATHKGRVARVQAACRTRLRGRSMGPTHRGRHMHGRRRRKPRTRDVTLDNDWAGAPSGMGWDAGLCSATYV